MSIPARKIIPERSIAPNRRVLIVTDDVKRSAQLIEHLRDLGLDVMMSHYDGVALTDLPSKAPAAVLCVLTDYVEHGAAIVADLRCRFEPSEFPILGRLTRKAGQDHPFDSVLFAPVHATQVARRLSSMIRMGQMEREIVRRVETLQQDFQIEHTLSDDQLRRPFRILFIGRADPAYMSVANALQGKNAQMVAAFTSFSAFDYLHDGEFDAVVINALQSSEPGLTIAETMRRNPRLYHVPTLLLAKDDAVDMAELRARTDIHDIITASADGPEIAGRILELANAFRLHQKLKSEFSSVGGDACTDAATGAFNKAFLSAYLRRVSRDCRMRNVPLSILTVKLVPESLSAVDHGVVSASLNGAVKLISGIVRMQDVVARVEDDTVVIAFPEERNEEVERIAQRVTSFIEDAVFQSSPTDGGALSIAVETAIVGLDDMNDPARSAAGPAISIVR